MIEYLYNTKKLEIQHRQPGTFAVTSPNEKAFNLAAVAMVQTCNVLHNCGEMLSCPTWHLRCVLSCICCGVRSGGARRSP